MFPLYFAMCNYAGNKSGLHYFLDMHDSLAVEDQEEDHTTLEHRKQGDWQKSADASAAWGGPSSSVRVPPEGSVPRNYDPYPYGVADSKLAGRRLTNPLPRNRSVYERGQKQYNIFCAPCHGYTGMGDGPVAPRLSAVPSLMSESMRSWRDGEFYHIITLGRGRMLPYAAQIIPKDRWAIIHYLRLLHKKTPAK